MLLLSDFDYLSVSDTVFHEASGRLHFALGVSIFCQICITDGVPTSVLYFPVTLLFYFIHLKRFLYN